MVSHRIEVSLVLISAASAYHKHVGNSEKPSIGQTFAYAEVPQSKASRS
jgi:hypothetical protein